MLRTRVRESLRAPDTNRLLLRANALLRPAPSRRMNTDRAWVSLSQAMAAGRVTFPPHTKKGSHGTQEHRSHPLGG